MLNDRRHAYHQELEAIGRGCFVTVHRRDASAVSGAIFEIKDHGAKISFQDPHGRVGTNIQLFIAYHDMRGIGIYIQSPE